jgi:endonuclease G
MGTNVFNFTGPVTIHIQSGDAVAQIIPQQVLAADAARLPAVEKVIRFDTNYDAKEGYKEDFLAPGNAALRVPMPKVAASRMGEIFMDFSRPGEPFLFKYRHYSLVMNKKRRLQMWSAVNVDYSAERRDGRSRAELGTDKWIPDPRIPTKFQITDPDFYQPAGNIDRGHIVRREDSAWGDSPDELEYSNSDTFHWTNCTPQHEAFNQENPRGYSGRKGIWGEFEAYAKSQITQNEERCCILAGPVLRPGNPSADFGSGNIQYPIEFWKVIVVASGDDNSRKLQAFGFIFSQADVVRDFGIEFVAGRFARYQKKLSVITQRSGVEFDQALLAADTKQ